MISITFPDGAQRQFSKGVTGAEIAAQISPSLVKRTVAMVIDGEVSDLADAIDRDASLEFIGREDPRALSLIRHDCAHVLAEAVQKIFPGTQVTIGPVIENGFYYDFFRNEPFSIEDLAEIEKEMASIISKNRPFTKEVWHREEAIEHFRQKGEDFKVELIKSIPEGETLKIYKQGEWLDLCRGPHMTSTGKIGQAFKLLKVAGAYWRGDSNREVLSRIYGCAFAKKDELDAYLHQLEEAEKRDHRKLGAQMKLFHFQQEAPGSVFWHEKGWTLFHTLYNYISRRQKAAGYFEVNSPDMLDRQLWEMSGHWEKFQENMFITQTADERVFALKPMSCPGHVQIFKNGLKSYRDLPLRMAEFGKVHRYEPSGALHGLMRVRSFTQDDAHAFIREDQITEEAIAMNDLITSIYSDLGFNQVAVKFSDRPEKRVGSDETWDRAESALLEAVQKANIPYTVNPGEGAFYGPKLEYVLRDAIGRDWQCATVQVDLNMPGRFGAFFIGADSERHVPVMIHRAILGSLERFIGILIENYAGNLPLWLAPVQIMVCTITSAQDDYARSVQKRCVRLGLRAELDLRNEKINYKVREHSHDKIPVLLVVGAKEASEEGVSIRRLGSNSQATTGLIQALDALVNEATPPDLR